MSENTCTLTDPDGNTHEWDPEGTIDVKVDDQIIASIAIKNAIRIECSGEWIAVIVNLLDAIGCSDRVAFRYMPSEMRQ